MKIENPVGEAGGQIILSPEISGSGTNGGSGMEMEMEMATNGTPEELTKTKRHVRLFFHEEIIGTQ